MLIEQPEESGLCCIGKAVALGNEALCPFEAGELLAVVGEERVLKRDPCATDSSRY